MHAVIHSSFDALEWRQPGMNPKISDASLSEGVGAGLTHTRFAFIPIASSICDRTSSFGNGDGICFAHQFVDVAKKACVKRVVADHEPIVTRLDDFCGQATVSECSVITKSERELDKLTGKGRDSSATKKHPASTDVGYCTGSE